MSVQFVHNNCMRYEVATNSIPGEQVTATDCSMREESPEIPDFEVDTAGIVKNVRKRILYVSSLSIITPVRRRKESWCMPQQSWIYLFCRPMHRGKGPFNNLICPCELLYIPTSEFLLFSIIPSQKIMGRPSFECTGIGIPHRPHVSLWAIKHSPLWL